VQRDRRRDFFAPHHAACNHSFSMRLVVGAIAVVSLALVGKPAAAERYRIEAGETLEHIARAYNCTVEELQRANKLDTTLIRAGKTLRIPACKPRKAKARRGARATDKVAAATGPVRTPGELEDADDQPKRGRKRKEIAIEVVTGQSVGAPWDGELHDGVRLHLGEGFKIRRPHRAWGASHVVTQVQRALDAVRGKFPNAHVLAIGDISARNGGAITEHRSHQSGRDIDIGLYFTKVPEGYPESFVSANSDLDLRKTFALVQEFARTADDASGVQKIYLDFGVQGRLYKWALAHDVPRGYLEQLFQYPHGRGASAGLVRHEPHHDDHMHVRFKCALDDDGCTANR
jgi:murein endopeptidase